MKPDATVLIVDDEKHTREGLRMSLEEEFDVYVSANRAETPEVLRSEQVDVMVTDLRLGGEDGMELIEPTGRVLVCAHGREYGQVEAQRPLIEQGDAGADNAGLLETLDAPPAG